MRTTLVIPIIGDPVAQVATPDLWNRAFRENGSNIVCVPIHLKRSGLKAFIEWVRDAENVPGFLSTIPYKADLVAICDIRGNEVDVVGAANTVRKNKDGQLECAMFDGVGMVNAITLAGVDFDGLSVLVIGAGAAGGAIAYEALYRGAKHVTLKDPCTQTLNRLVANLSRIYPDRFINTTKSEQPTYQVIINASPQGSAPNDLMPIELNASTSLTVVADAVTEPEETNFIKRAKEIGLYTVSGKDMASAQASYMKQYLGICSF